MKRIVLTFGLIAGAILSVMMVVAITFRDQIGYDRSEIIGYSTMVLAFLLIYFGVRAYRDDVAGGTVRFGRAFTVGALIATIGSLCYVATWQVIYYNFAPDFMQEYQAHALEEAREKGQSAQEILQMQEQMARFAELYENPLFNAAITFLEPLPVALIISLVSAGILSRGRARERNRAGGEVRTAT